MRIDFSPLYRSTVGFDRLFQILDQAGGAETVPAYPPYNIERTAENAYRVSIAVAGFAEKDLSIEVKELALTVRGDRAEKADEQREVLFQGIAGRSFERRFQLADHVQVVGAVLENGLLHIDLVREIPEAKKPKLIPIKAGASRALEGAKIEGVKTAA
ncbi:MAG: Hsp20 family protein [Hyphomicrobiales bacterium]|nr:Hsp20 family protein [Hyphomicrobiales bacterium]OQW82975.1 MAG: molecular chaperone [Proteobacteria bacterium ST_bin15]